MKKYFKIFIVEHQNELVPNGYSTSTLSHPIFKEPLNCDLRCNFDTIEEAETALNQHGKEWTEYTIQSFYKIES